MDKIGFQFFFLKRKSNERQQESNQAAVSGIKEQNIEEPTKQQEGNDRGAMSYEIWFLIGGKHFWCKKEIGSKSGSRRGVFSVVGNEEWFCILYSYILHNYKIDWIFQIYTCTKRKGAETWMAKFQSS